MVTKKTFRSLLLGGSALLLSALMLNLPLRSEGKSLQEQSNSPTLGQKAPEVNGPAGNWINTDGQAVHLHGKDGLLNGNRVVVLTFWTHGCINCKRTIPFWNAWAKQYAPKNGQSSDVAVVSVHTPELDFERNPTNVRRFVHEKGIVFPVVTDNDYAAWNAYKVQSWPTTILIDKQGRIRARWEGELNYDNSGDYKKVELTIEQLRHEKG